MDTKAIKSTQAWTGEPFRAEFTIKIAEIFDRPLTDYSSWTAEEIDAEITRIETRLNVGPGLVENLMALAFLTADVTEPDVYDIGFALLAVGRQAIAMPRLFECIMADFKARGLDGSGFAAFVASVRESADEDAR